MQQFKCQKYSFLSPIEQIVKINSIIKNIKKFAKHRFDHKRISKTDYSDIKALKSLRLKMIRQNKKIVDSLHSLSFYQTFLFYTVLNV